MLEFQEFNYIWDKKMADFERHAEELVAAMKVCLFSLSISLYLCVNDSWLYLVVWVGTTRSRASRVPAEADGQAYEAQVQSRAA